MRLLFTGKASLEAFALSADGSKVWVGSPLDGIHVASTTDYAFTQKSAIETKCLAVNDDGLWACSNEKVGFIVGLSKDDGATFEPRLRFCEIRGPLACNAGTTTGARCPMVWPALRNTLGCTSDDGGMLDAARADAGIAPTGGAGGCDCGTVVPIDGWRSIGGAAATLIAAALAILRRSRRRGGSQS